MQCLRCGVDTETGCAHLECPQAEVYKQMLSDQQGHMIVEPEPENDNHGEGEDGLGEDHW